MTCQVCSAARRAAPRATVNDSGGLVNEAGESDTRWSCVSWATLAMQPGGTPCPGGGGIRYMTGGSSHDHGDGGSGRGTRAVDAWIPSRSATSSSRDSSGALIQGPGHEQARLRESPSRRSPDPYRPACHRALPGRGLRRGDWYIRRWATGLVLRHRARARVLAGGRTPVREPHRDQFKRLRTERRVSREPARVRAAERGPGADPTLAPAGTVTGTVVRAGQRW